MPKYPDIHVCLIGSSDNAMHVLGATRAALKKGGADKEEIEAFTKDATSGDYDHLLQTVMAWVEVE